MEYDVNFSEQTLKELTDAIKGVQVEELNVSENGTYTAPSGKAYSPVKVNVSGGGSDFSTAEVTIKSNDIMLAGMPAILEAGTWGANQPPFDMLYVGQAPVSTTPVTYVMPLYKGVLYIEFDNQYIVTVVSGSAEADSNTVTITGDCSIEISRV